MSDSQVVQCSLMSEPKGSELTDSGTSASHPQIGEGETKDQSGVISNLR